jgi:NAD-dependent DNA ligase
MSVSKIKHLIKLLNEYTKAYDEGNPLITDAEWDELYF